MAEEFAIRASKIEKKYKLYERNRDRVLDAFGLAGRKDRFKYHYALKGVDFEVKKGETVGIIGTNGSGKSTLLKILTGVLTPTSGEVNVNGRISALLELGAGFNMDYNGIENIYLNGTMMGFSEKEIDAKLQDILDFADIGDFVHQPVTTYSSGMFVRLAFAVAINIEPEILIVDEALSVGDVFFQAKCYHKFDEFKEMGKTILFVSHDLSSIAKYCDRVVLLNKGTKLGEGTPKQMIDIYKQVLVGQYEPNFNEEGKDSLLNDSELMEAANKKKDKDKNQNQDRPEDALEYGSKKALIRKYYVTDENNRESNAIIKGTDFTIHLEVEFMDHVEAPIFAYTFKNIKGTEITGTNTMFEKAFLEPCEKGMVKHISYKQNMNLQGGEYLLSFGVTGYEGDGFTVYHRLYDVLNVTVISDKDTVGYYDMNSKVTVEDI